MAHIIGVHPIDTGGIHMAARRAANAGADCVQVFTAPPRFYGDRSSIRPERVQRFRQTLEEVGMDPRHVMVHGAYVLGVATPEEDKWVRAAGGLKKEMERSTTLGIGGVCFHPGSAGRSPVEAALDRVARAMTDALRGVGGETRLLVENTAGGGQGVGRTADEVGGILARLPADVRARAGYGLDSCHLFASGYDITESAQAFRRILDEFEEAAGEPPAFFHLNDSVGGLGSNRDRHTLIGEGEIGVEPFRWLLEDRRSLGVPLILETPEQNTEIGEDDSSADPWDARMVTLLRELG